MRRGGGAGAPFLAAQFAPGSRLGRIAFALLLDAFDRRPDADEMRVDGERRLEGLERRFLAVEREIDLAKPGERAEMMRLELQRTLDIADAGVEIAEQKINGRPL